MFPYLILMFAPLLVYQVSITSRENKTGKGWSLSIGKTPQILHNSLIVPAFFLLLFILLVCRHETLGRDLDNYHVYFTYYSGASFSSVLKERQDILYWMLNWAVGHITNDYQVFLAVVALIVVLPIGKLYSEDKQYGFLKLVLFMNMSNFVMLFSGLRQSIAISMGLIAYEFVRRKRPFLFLFFALLALGFHHTAFMILLYYPVYHMRLNKNQLWFIIPSIVLTFVFNRQIFGLLTQIMVSFMGDKYDVEMESTGAYLMIILFALFAVAAYFFPDEEKMGAEAKGLRNFLLMALLLQCFAPVHEWAMRMNYYFIIFIPVVMPQVFKYTKDNIKDVARIAKGVVVGFFVVYYLYTVYRIIHTGSMEGLGIYPYVAFWEY